MNVLFIGKPGSGKGTISKKLRDEFGYKLICTGDLLRMEKALNTELGKKIGSIIDSGNIVPDEISIKLMYNEFQKPVKLGQYFILDGYPRTQKAAESLTDMINQPIVIWLNISDETTIKRNLLKGKSHNQTNINEEIIKNRLKIFDEETLPLKSYYGKKVININAEGEIDAVYKLVIDALYDNVKEPKF